MRYNINQSVVIKKCKTIKQVSDSEVICGVIIYYMSDKTSYSESEILSTQEDFNQIEDLVSSPNIDNFIEVFDNGRMVKGLEKLFNIPPKIEEKSVNINKKWFNWFNF